MTKSTTRHRCWTPNGMIRDRRNAARALPNGKSREVAGLDEDLDSWVDAARDGITVAVPDQRIRLKRRVIRRVIRRDMVLDQRIRIKGRDTRRDMVLDQHTKRRDMVTDQKIRRRDTIPDQRERNTDTIADPPDGRVIIERDEGQTEKEGAKHAQ